MRYDGGYINPRISWAKLDGRNKMVEHYSHRIIVRDRQNCINVEKWFEQNICELRDIYLWSPHYASVYRENYERPKPQVYKIRETYTRYHVYLQEEDLVQFVIGFET
ncbi:hypothetical protein EB001_02670 [bacterium]|nr:hypothetical protein [bacterium]